MSKILLKMKSPLVVLGKSLNNNYKESLEYISGDKVRAGFAKYILLNCPIFEFNRREKVNGSQFKYNWVYYRNNQECENCIFSSICKNFSNMKFSFFYPEDVDVLPFTAMKCKYHKEHGFRDILIKQDEAIKCKRCVTVNEDDLIGRMEAAYGLRKKNRIFDINKIMYTRNAINKYTKISKEGALYTIIAVDNTNFEGNIEGIEPMLEAMNSLNDRIVRIGSYVSIGMGAFEVSIKNEKEEFVSLLQKLKNFNNRIKNKDRNKNYIPILFKSDAKLGLEKVRVKPYLNDDEYRQKWYEILLEYIGFKRFTVKSVYTETENYRGYDLSNGADNAEEDIVVLNKMGTTILLETEEKLEDIISKLKTIENEGIGFERENGFGQVEICNELHLKGEIYE